MARTKQTARQSTSSNSFESSDEETEQQKSQDVDPELVISEEEKKKREELKNAPLQSELKYLEKRWTKKGTAYITEPLEDEDVPEQNVDWYQKFALCITRQYDRKNECVIKTTLQVNSPALKDILRDLIGNYPGETFMTSNISVDWPAHSLYHYRPELKQALREQEPGSDGASHLPILIDFIEEDYHDAIVDGDNLRAQGMTTYQHLWTIFKPGILIYARVLGQPRLYKLLNYHYTYGEHAALELYAEYVDFDGYKFGLRQTWLSVYAFIGTAEITTLNAYPLSFHHNPQAVCETLMKRGRYWEAHAGQNFRNYQGVAIDAKCNRYNINGRIMIDTKTFHRIHANLAFKVSEISSDFSTSKRKQGANSNEAELIPVEDVTLAALTDDQALLATSTVRAFSFTEKVFLDFFIDNVSPIDWNMSCFEQLVLPESQKELVQALVMEHTARANDPTSATFDDIVKDKGRGLILVLHGPPGVGKTLTAECVAEISCRPLYMVSSGELGTNSSDLDVKLTKILDLASTWKAVLLIDEADVFLESRSLHDMQRNSMVSIFLRTLEYYAGILFMTTNRVQTFDDAFKSRIHVPLKYEELPESSRLQVWKNFISKIDGVGSQIEISEEGYQRLAAGALNGRQIKNVVRTAKSLANYKKRKLDCEQLETVMNIQMEFERELNADLAAAKYQATTTSSLNGNDREVVIVERI